MHESKNTVAKGIYLGKVGKLQVLQDPKAIDVIQILAKAVLYNTLLGN